MPPLHTGRSSAATADPVAARPGPTGRRAGSVLAVLLAAGAVQIPAQASFASTHPAVAAALTADTVAPTEPTITSADGYDLASGGLAPGVTRRVRFASSDAEGLAGFCYSVNAPLPTQADCGGYWVAAGSDGSATVGIAPALWPTNQLTVEARDKAGNTASASITISTGLNTPAQVPVTSLTKAANGTLVAFRGNSDGSLWATNQTSPTSGFRSWYQVGAPGHRGTPATVLSPAAGGTVHAFVRGSDSRITEYAQSGPTSSFDSTTVLGGPLDVFVGDPAAVLAADGTIVVAGVDAMNNLKVTRQSSPGGAFEPWATVGTRVTGAVSAVLSPAGGGTVQLLARSVDGHLKAYAQTGPGSAPAAGPALPAGTPFFAGDPSVTVSAGGGLIVAAVDVNGDVWATDQASTGGDFRYWYKISLFGGLSGATSLVLSPGADGTVNIVARTTDGHIALFGQSGPTSGFSSGSYLGTTSPTFAGDPRVALAANGSMIVTATDTTGTTWAIDQPAPGAGFRTWYRL
ncbi:hypothetical protein OG689_31245 [Kitasatospora sp. NBC_00240]|uniref:hypothetical protein n=1 Tax=Kitasatospora sp. NBC_00240 TaxID=2903567 RepID=UPI002257CD03|nr:hypothetical protein [Kitasatospora sp. NBC_00240]MCX5213694.1 hypothetical protein [Kitasatospora sp. NBC_00240]